MAEFKPSTPFESYVFSTLEELKNMMKCLIDLTGYEANKRTASESKISPDTIAPGAETKSASCIKDERPNMLMLAKQTQKVIENIIPGTLFNHKLNPEPEKKSCRTRNQLKRSHDETAKMLIIFQSGEQRLITFTLPTESCTVQELLSQVGVTFPANSNIQCISNPGAGIDYVVTIGLTVDYGALMAVAENTMKQPHVQAKVQAQMQQHQQAQAQHQPQVRAAQVAQQQQVPQPQNVSPQNLIPNVKKPKPQYVNGLYAICNHCDTASIDHSQCQRCGREIQDNVKVVHMPPPYLLQQLYLSSNRAPLDIQNVAIKKEP